MLIKQTVRKSSDELLKDIFGTNPESLQFLVLSNPDTVQAKYKYEDGERTDEVIGHSVTLHVVGHGSEIDVKIENPSFTLESRGLKELKSAKPVDLQVSYVNNNYYFKASDLKAGKQPNA